MKYIESRNNQTIKNIAALRERRERESQGLFYFEGVHLLEEYLRAGNMPYAVFVREDVRERYKELLSRLECEAYLVSESVYNKLTDEKAPQGIFTVSSRLNNVSFLSGEELLGRINGNSIMMCDLQDNGNVGTIIRTAATLDCSVILCGGCADVYSSKTVRATMGALFTADIFVCKDTEGAINALKEDGIRVIAAALRNNSLTLGEFETRSNDCFVIGNEGQGLSQSVTEACSESCIIPMSGRTESLNAASAAAILLWEAKRRRMK